MSEAIERGGAALDLDAAEVRAADRAARIWDAGECGPIALGSEAHKQAFCRMLLDTHNPYRPSIVDWPALDPQARDRLVSLEGTNSIIGATLLSARLPERRRRQ